MSPLVPSFRSLLGRLLLPRGVARFSSSVHTYEHILVDKKGAGASVGFIQLNRPKALNALCNGLIRELSEALDNFECDNQVKTVVLTGSNKAFAAGADIKEMCGLTYPHVYGNDLLVDWDRVALTRKPIIAAVCGYALGGGCELAMMCDIIYASDTAKFGQPEIKLGTIPGAGGTQRLVRAVGKSRAMELILSGDMIDAKEAVAAGLVSRVFPADEVVPKAIELAEKIGRYSGLATKAAKEAINAAYNMTLSEGLRFEKRLFHASFSTNDCKEGMTAFAEKREAKFTDT
ncbi:putative enoyl-CoA hydratase, mitochondrial [Clonorchis sinensis]|uniref:Probable enoyl-CoA hydratase, mitochondrial n=1 Tax=Clonorchis sinensis TaxID=79923 RepID=A0A8T1N0E8_CLOSI|nr:putative enoyl-CoA hydratase, mitochondrial [Clonorchis sinensis]